MTARPGHNPQQHQPIRNIGNTRTTPEQGCYRCYGCYSFSDPAHAEPQPPVDPAEPGPLVYSVKEAADVLRIGYSTMKELLRSGEIPSFKLGSRRLVSGEDLANWVRQQASRGAA